MNKSQTCDVHISSAHPLLMGVVRVLGGRVLRCVRLGPARQVHQLGLGPQAQEVLPVHVARLVSQVASSLMIQVNLGQEKYVYMYFEFFLSFPCVRSVSEDVYYSLVEIKTDDKND